MEVQKRGGTKIITNEACLPPSRPSLTSFALEYGRALRMIRVSIFLNDICNMPQGVPGAGIYRPEVQHEPLDQTDLKDGIDAT